MIELLEDLLERMGGGKKEREEDRKGEEGSGEWMCIYFCEFTQRMMARRWTTD